MRIHPLALEQCHQRIDGVERIKIDDEAMAEFRDRLERKHLWPYFGFQIEHDAEKSSRRLTDANRRDVGVRRLHARGERCEIIGAIDPREIEHESIGIAQNDELMLDRRRRFENHPRVFLRGP